MALDLSGDWAIHDDPEDVELYVRRDASIDTDPVTVENALVTATDAAEMSRLAIDRVSLTFHLWANQIEGGVRPKTEDVIGRDRDGTRWLIKGVGTLDMGTRFKCVTVQEP